MNVETHFFKTSCEHNSKYTCFACVASLNSICDKSVYKTHDFYIPVNKKRKDIDIFKVHKAEEERIFTILMNSKRATECRHQPAYRYSTRFVRKIEGYV
jgi:hypothetical protein